MDKTKIIRMAAGIRDAANHVSVAGTENWTNMLGIVQTAEAIIAEARKEETADGWQEHQRSPGGRIPGR